MWKTHDTRSPRSKVVLPSAFLALLLLTALIVAGCGGGSGSDSSDDGSSPSQSDLAVVGYGAIEPAYMEVLEPAFQKTPAGKGIGFNNSFEASGTQSRALAAGQPASIVHLSLASEMEYVVEEAGIVSKDWKEQPHGGIATDSVVVILVQKGNPLGIHDFKDLEESDEAEILTPNPFSSGSARWNIMAVYGSAIEEGATPVQALEAVKTVLEKTVAQPGSGRDAIAAFSQGEGNVVLTYENEAIKAVNSGEEVEYVIPTSTIQIETPIAVTEEAPEPAAEDFLKFLWSDQGQKLWAENGYRPVVPSLVDPKRFPTPEKLFKISKFGGWQKVADEFFGEPDGSITNIEAELGISTGG